MLALSSKMRAKVSPAKPISRSAVAGMNLEASTYPDDLSSALPEMPILLLCIGAATEIRTKAEEWRAQMQAIEDAVFCTNDLQESLAVLTECENLGTPVGLIVIVSELWNQDLCAMVEELRQSGRETELPILLGCEVLPRVHLYESVEAGVNLAFSPPFDWELIRRKAQSALRAAAQAWKLQSGKDHAEELLAQHKQSVLSQNLWRMDMRTHAIEFSDNFRRMSGFSAQQIGNSLDECLCMIHPQDLSRLSQSLSGADWKLLPDELNFEFRLRHRNGHWRWVLVRGRIERDESGDPLAISGSHTDITEAKTTDPVTGLANRFQFEDWLEENFAPQSSHMAVILVGIDRYALIRDSFGQALGDQLLRLAGERLSSVLDAGNRQLSGWMLARLSDDEFAIAIPEVEDAKAARAIAEQVQEALAKGIWLEGNELFLSTSAGFVLEEDRQHFEEVWRDAEIAMHSAKADGGNRIILFDRIMRESVLERMASENDLKRAIEQWEFEVYYQPKVTLKDERIVGFEALLRWQHPTKGIVPPSQFIPLAEECGLIIPIGIRTVREACETIRKWQDEFPQRKPLEVSVNLSVRQFQDLHLNEEIQKILAETKILPSTLQFEVTESVLMQEPERALEIVDELRQMGVGLKIDDFGTGYSSLSYLHKLPFDTLKIDRSFISTMGEDHAAFEIVRAIILLAESLGLHVVAEGIETRLQAEELRKLGCEFGQGYLFAPPLTIVAAQRMLMAQSARTLSDEF